MTFELDPDLRLHTRLALGRGWRLASTLLIPIAGVTALASGKFFFLPIPNPRGVSNDPGFLPLALFLLMFGPARAIARLLDLERGGLLDQTRLCGRPSRRVLAAAVAGSLWPFAVASLILLANHIRLEGDAASLSLAALVFAAALAASLLAYGTLPPTMTSDSRFVMPLLLILAFVALAYLRVVDWVQRLAFDDPRALVTIATTVVTLPAAVWVAHRRLERPPAPASRSGVRSLRDVVSRLLPRAGPPEFTRQLRCTVLSGGTLATVLVAPLSVWLVDRLTPRQSSSMRILALNSIPYMSAFVGAFAVSSTIRREFETHALDLVRLTPRRAEAIALEWYLAVALPFWLAGALAVVVLRVVDPELLVVGWWLPAFALLMPALGTVEGFQRRHVSAYLWLPGLLMALMIPYIALQDPRAAVRVMAATPNLAWITTAGPPWHLNLRALVPAFVVALSIGAASGRLRRSDGPPLVGAAMAAGVVAVALTLRSFPLIVFPRIFPGVLALLASFAAEERAVPTQPWSRLAIGGAAALTAGALIGREGGMDWPTSLVTGLAGSAAFGTGLLVHELAWPVPVLSLALRSGTLLVLERGVWRFVYDIRQALRLPLIPPMLQAIDVAMLLAAFAVAIALHVRAQHARI